jgi:hypothetical protein
MGPSSTLSFGLGPSLMSSFRVWVWVCASLVCFDGDIMGLADGMLNLIVLIELVCCC